MQELVDKVLEMASTIDGLFVLVISAFLLFVALSVAKKVLKIVAFSGAVALGSFVVLSYMETGNLDDIQIPEFVKNTYTTLADKATDIKVPDESEIIDKLSQSGSEG